MDKYIVNVNTVDDYNAVGMVAAESLVEVTEKALKYFGNDIQSIKIEYVCCDSDEFIWFKPEDAEKMIKENCV